MANLNLNKVVLGGRIVRDPELRMTSAGIPVTSFSMAVNRRGSDKDMADFISIVAWRKTAELICQYFRKGGSICVAGRLQTRSWEDKNGTKQYATDVVADEVYFVDSKGQSAQAGGRAADEAPGSTALGDDEDLPF